MGRIERHCNTGSMQMFLTVIPLGVRCLKGACRLLAIRSLPPYGYLQDLQTAAAGNMQ